MKNLYIILTILCVFSSNAYSDEQNERCKNWQNEITRFDAFNKREDKVTASKIKTKELGFEYLKKLESYPGTTAQDLCAPIFYFTFLREIFESIKGFEWNLSNEERLKLKNIGFSYIEKEALVIPKIYFPMMGLAMIRAMGIAGMLDLNAVKNNIDTLSQEMALANERVRKATPGSTNRHSVEQNETKHLQTKLAELFQRVQN